MGSKVTLLWGFFLAFCSLASPEQIYKWKTIQFSNLNRPLDSLVDGVNVYYNEANVLTSSAAYDVDTGFVCAAFPRVKPSVPVTVGCFRAQDYNLSNPPKFTAFPSVADNDLPNWPKSASASVPQGDGQWANSGKKFPRPYNFINVHKVRFDECGRLWFIDVGTVETATPTLYHNPILWAFEVKKGAGGQLESRPYLRYEVTGSEARGFRNLVVDIHKHCDDYHVYLPNTKSNRIVVYSSERNTHWHLEHASMKPVMKEISYTVQGEVFTMVAGVYTVTLGPKDKQGYRDAYYTPCSGTGQFKVNTRVLRDRVAVQQNKVDPSAFQFLGYRGEGIGQTRVQVFDEATGVLFSGSVEEQAVKCWNPKTLLTPDNYGTAYSHPDMVYGTDVKLDKQGNLWSLSNRLATFLVRGLDVNVVNFSLFRVKPKDVIQGTVCA